SETPATEKTKAARPSFFMPGVYVRSCCLVPFAAAGIPLCIALFLLQLLGTDVEIPDSVGSARRTLQDVGEWLSLVEHLVRDQGVGGSNPLSPTIVFKDLTEFRINHLVSPQVVDRGNLRKH